MEPSLLSALQWEQDRLSTRARATIFHGDVGRDLNEPLNLQSGIVNVSLGKTRCISSSNERYPSTANEPHNLRERWQLHMGGTRARHGSGKADQLRVRNHSFPEHLSSTHSTLQAVSNRNYKWQNKIKMHLCPHLFSMVLSFLNNFMRWAPSPQPGCAPRNSAPGIPGLCLTGALFLGHLPHFGGSWPGVERRAAGSCIAQSTMQSWGCLQALSPREGSWERQPGTVRRLRQSEIGKMQHSEAQTAPYPAAFHHQLHPALMCSIAVMGVDLPVLLGSERAEIT